MKFSLTPVFLESNNDRIAVISKSDLSDGISLSGHQVIISNNNSSYYCDKVVSSPHFEPGIIGLSKTAFASLNLSFNSAEKVQVTLTPRETPESYLLVKQRMLDPNFRLTKEMMNTIVGDVVSGRLSQIEQSAFVLAQQFQEWSMDEIQFFTESIAYTGETIDFGETTYDKHSLGGVPGNKVTLLIVPIIAAADLLIPKTSSRAITSPSGTADTMEALGCEVSFNSSEIVEMAKKTRGLIVWGGALNLAPADRILIDNAEYPLGIDPKSMFMASIMAKKKALGVDFVVLDIPTGKGAKVTSLPEARHLARAFGELGQRLDIHVECGITFASLPVGHTVGPALEAREALSALIDPKHASTSLVEKSTGLAGMLLEQAGKAPRGQGQNKAKELLYSGRAYQKMKEIIEVQGGNPEMKPTDVPIGQYTCEYRAPASGWPADIDNKMVNQIAKAAGAPKEQGAGIQFIIKKESVNAGDIIFRVHTTSSERLTKVESLIQKLNPITIEGMLLERI